MNDTFLNTVNTQTWSNGRHPVRCVNRIWETPDVTTFCFMAEQPIMFFFKPGQFVTLELMIDGEQTMRSYTIASSPSVPYSFSITVKRVPGGQVSNSCCRAVVVLRRLCLWRVGFMIPIRALIWCFVIVRERQQISFLDVN